MDVRTYPDAAAFLRDTQAELEREEAANGLMLGVCARLARYPERIDRPPCLKAVLSGEGLVLAAIQTPPFNLIVTGGRGDLDAAARALAAELVGEGWSLPGVLGPSDAAAAVAGRLGLATGRAVRLRQREMVMELRAVQTPVPERGRLRPAAENEAGLLTDWWQDFNRDTMGDQNPDVGRTVRQRLADGTLYVWDDAGPVSLAAKTRPTKTGISIGPVYTPPEQRRKGYATACVGELSRLLLAEGWAFCALFVNQANPTARHVYERIGYRPLCEYDDYVFEG